MKQRIFPLCAAALAFCIVAASAIEPSHNAEHFQSQGADSVIYAAYDANGVMLACRWNRFNDWHTDNWLVSGAVIYKEIPIDSNYHPVESHNHSDISYEWEENTDGCVCTATAKCSGCDETYTSESVNAEITDTQSATCIAAGSTTYTATFTNPIFATQTHTIETPATHNYEWKFISSSTLVYECTLCHERDESQTITFSSYENYDYKKYTSKTQKEKLKIQADFGEYFDLWFNYLKSFVDPIIYE